MNSLSWILYFADVLSDIHFFIFAIVFVFGITAVLVDKKGEPDYFVKKIPLILILVAISIILPSKNTIYAIAASELGEKVIGSQISTKAQKAIDAWLDRQISGDAKP